MASRNPRRGLRPSARARPRSPVVRRDARCRRDRQPRRESLRRLDRPEIAWPDSDDSDSRARPARRRPRVSASDAGRRLCEARPSPRQRRIGSSGSSMSGRMTCASGSPSRTLNSITFGPSARQHQADVQKAAKRMSLGRHPGDHRLDDVAHDPRLERARRSSGLGANAPMPPVFGPRSSSKIRL